MGRKQLEGSRENAKENGKNDSGPQRKDNERSDVRRSRVVVHESKKRYVEVKKDIGEN